MESIWFAILGFAFLMYVVTDGFDLGAGILHLFSLDEEYQSICMNGILGVWHLNQTWLIVFGAGLFGSFPLAYGLVLSALYIPVGLLLFGVVLRGVGLEYHEAVERKSLAALAFGLGSLLTAMAQGLGVGAFLMGLPMEGTRFAGGVWYFISPFSLLLAVGLPFFYVMLGATRLIGKTDDSHRERSISAAKIAAICSLVAAVLVVAWLLVARPIWTRDWFAWPGMAYTLGPIAAGAIAFAPLLLSIIKGQTGAPFYWAAAVTVLIGSGIMAGLPPYIVPPDLTLAQAAAPAEILTVMLVTAGIFIPLVLVYTSYLYRVFRGKVEPGDYGG